MVLLGWMGRGGEGKGFGGVRCGAGRWVGRILGRCGGEVGCGEVGWGGNGNGKGNGNGRGGEGEGGGGGGGGYGMGWDRCYEGGGMRRVEMGRCEGGMEGAWAGDGIVWVRGVVHVV